MPAISVIIPTFNRGDLVLNALNSVLNQTFKDYEVIVIDDGSTDDTAEKLAPYRGRIRYVYQSNQGASAAQNRGIEAAEGEWVAILASDDVWLPTKLETQFKLLARFGPEFRACFTDCTFMGNPDLNLSAFEQAGLQVNMEADALQDAMFWVLARYPAIYVQSLLVSRSLLNRVGKFDEKMTVSEDTDLLFRLALETRFCFVTQPLVRIDRTPLREVGLMELFVRRDERVFVSRERMYRKWIGLLGEQDSQVCQRISDDLKELYYNWTISMLYRGRISEAFRKACLVRGTGTSWRLVFSRLAFRVLRRASSSFGKLCRN